MTCTCKAELASILRSLGDKWADAQSHREDEGDGRNSAENAEDLAYAFHELADRLCPQAEPVLDGWRAKVEIEERNPGDWRVVWNPGRDGVWWLRSTGGWARCELLIPQRDASFTTKSAARAALLAASEPGVEPARGPCTCNRNHVDDDEHTPDCGKPSPSPAVAFDAERLVSAISKARDLPNEQFMLVLRTGIKESESAGYARAKAEQTPRRWPEGYNDWHAQNPGHADWIMRWNRGYGVWDMVRVCHIEDGAFWLPAPAAPAAAKEPPHAD